MSAFIVQNGKYVKSVKAGSSIQLFANDAGFYNNPEFLVTDRTGSQILRQRVYTDTLENCWYDWTAPSSPGTYTFYQDSADLHSPDKQVTFTVTGDNGGNGGGNGLDLAVIKDYLPFIGLAIAAVLILLAILPGNKK